MHVFFSLVVDLEITINILTFNNLVWINTNLTSTLCKYIAIIDI